MRAGKLSNLWVQTYEEGTHLYHVEEIVVQILVLFDKMVATVGIVVNKEGKVLVKHTEVARKMQSQHVIPPTPPTTPPITPPTPPTTPPTSNTTNNTTNDSSNTTETNNSTSSSNTGEEQSVSAIG